MIPVHSTFGYVCINDKRLSIIDYSVCTEYIRLPRTDSGSGKREERKKERKTEEQKRGTSTDNNNTGTRAPGH